MRSRETEFNQEAHHFIRFGHFVRPLPCDGVSCTIDFTQALHSGSALLALGEERKIHGSLKKVSLTEHGCLPSSDDKCWVLWWRQLCKRARASRHVRYPACQDARAFSMITILLTIHTLNDTYFWRYIATRYLGSSRESHPKYHDRGRWRRRTWSRCIPNWKQLPHSSTLQIKLSYLGMEISDASGTWN